MAEKSGTLLGIPLDDLEQVARIRTIWRGDDLGAHDDAQTRNLYGNPSPDPGKTAIPASNPAGTAESGGVVYGLSLNSPVVIAAGVAVLVVLLTGRR